MKKQFKLLAILLTLVFSTFNLANKTLFPVVNATYVEGAITQDTIWTLVDSPFILSNNVTIYPNVTLSIEPGVDVRFGGAFSIVVSGRLYANGTGKTITFTSNREQPSAGDWNTIKFNGTEKSTLIGCFVAYATNGIFIENGDVEIRNSTISFCSQNGISVTNGMLVIRDSTVIDNDGNGICVTGYCQVSIQNNPIIANRNGILLTGSEISGVNINQNVISANTESGIRLDAGNHTNISIINNVVTTNNNGIHISSLVSTQINNNSISYNTVGILYDHGTHTVHYNDIYGNEMGMDTASDARVNAEYNYWGHESGPYHESLNPAGKGNPVGGDGINLDFIFFLTEPISYINTRPTAKLLTDKTLVPQDEIVMFFATDSFDERRIDRYLFNFGDGKTSGWTTLSIFTHKYAFSGTYYATVTVMDDFGAVSDNTVSVRIDVQNLPPLQVKIIDVSNRTVHEGEQVSIIAYVTDGTTAVENASVKVFSVKDGDFTPSSGYTNSTGYFTTTFTAPDVAQITNVRIVATASKNGYSDGSDHVYLEVLPFLSVTVTANPSLIKSEEIAQVTVYVKSNEQPIADAAVSLTCDSGYLSATAGVTNEYGNVTFIFTAPQVNTPSNVTILARATKAEYADGEGTLNITVNPGILSVQVEASSPTVMSRDTSVVTVYVTYNAAPVADALITVSSSHGSFSATTGVTDSQGYCTFIFNAPETTVQLPTVIIASATKDGYISGENQTTITVTPETTETQGGWPITTILLIVIPIAILVIVVVLVKLKIITVSTEEE